MIGFLNDYFYINDLVNFGFQMQKECLYLHFYLYLYCYCFENFLIDSYQNRLNWSLIPLIPLILQLLSIELIQAIPTKEYSNFYNMSYKILENNYYLSSQAQNNFHNNSIAHRFFHTLYNNSRLNLVHKDQQNIHIILQVNSRFDKIHMHFQANKSLHIDSSIDLFNKFLSNNSNYLQMQSIFDKRQDNIYSILISKESQGSRLYQDDSQYFQKFDRIFNQKFCFKVNNFVELECLLMLAKYQIFNSKELNEFDQFYWVTDKFVSLCYINSNQIVNIWYWPDFLRYQNQFFNWIN